MKKEYQVTILCSTGEYRPVSTIVNYEQSSGEDLSLNKDKRKEIQTKGIIKICQKRGWDKKDLIKYNYTKCKIRLYDKEAIEKENKERYEKIKEEKYATGEWKRPKSKESKE